METIDILTEKGDFSGKTASRKTIHRIGYWHKTVHVWIVNEFNKILLQKRSPEKETNPGLWDIACAGHISAGESSITSAIRELEEELGIITFKNNLDFLFTSKESSVHHKGRYIDNEFHDTYLLRTNVPVSDMKFQPFEVETAAYFSLDDICRRIDSKDPGLVSHPETYDHIIPLLKERFGE